ARAARGHPDRGEVPPLLRRARRARAVQGAGRATAVLAAGVCRVDDLEPLGKPARFHQDYIRVLPPHQTGGLIDDRLDLRQRWRSMPGLQMIFRRFAESKPHRSMADFVALALKSLGRL